MITDVWTAPDAEIAAFLDEFDEHSATPGGDATALFGPTFLVLDPAHALTMTPSALASALPARRRMFEQAGVGTVRRFAASQLRLDDRHMLISADWNADRTTGSPLRLSSTFLVRRESEGWRVLVYLNHIDVAALLTD